MIFTLQHEAEYIRELCRYLLLQGYSPHQITVLTTYTGQLLELRKLMPRTVFEGVRVTAVDNFQGEENDIILLSLVRSNKSGQVRNKIISCCFYKELLQTLQTEEFHFVLNFFYTRTKRAATSVKYFLVHIPLKPDSVAFA